MDRNVPEPAPGLMPIVRRRYRILGVEVDALSIAELNAIIAHAIAAGRREIIANHNLHSAYLFHANEAFRHIFNAATWTHIDGMPLVWMGRLRGLPISRDHRVTYVDWAKALIPEAARRGWRVFYLGAAPGVAERGAAVLRRQHPGLQIAVEHGYFDATRNAAASRAITHRIAAFRPHILFVGMGMPRQEAWILDNIDQLAANIVLPCGALMDYVAGVVRTPPRWMGSSGLEWLYRLCAEPRRLWRRYLLEPLLLLCLLCAARVSRAGPTTTANERAG